MASDASWERIVDAIDTKFGLIDHGRLQRPIEDDHELNEQVSFIIFERNGDRLRLERVSGPAIIDRKTVGAKRAGANVHFQNIYDPNEIAHKIVLYRSEGEDWAPIDLNSLGL